MLEYSSMQLLRNEVFLMVNPDLERIEELRLQMIKTALDKALTDARVVRVSEKLDELIYQFYINKPFEIQS